MSVGEKLRNLRKKAKRTLKEQSDIFGVSLNTVYRWEHDLAFPKKQMLEKIAAHYEAPLEWLFLGSYAQEEGIFDNGALLVEDSMEQQLVRMCRKLSEKNKYKILGYVERIYVEDMDSALRSKDKKE